MQAVILSAGKGTRLYPLTKEIPKVMVDILGKPILEHHLLLLRKYGIKEIFINLFTQADKITSYFKNGKKWGMDIQYAREKKLLGSAGALHYFKKKLKGNFFVLYGDVFMQLNLSKMLDFHIKKKSLFTIAVHEARHPKDSDLVEFNIKGKLKSWIKKPHNKKSGLNSAGLYILNERIFKFLPAVIPFDFAHDFIPLLLKKTSLFAYKTSERMIDIGTPERYNNLIKSL